MPKRNVITDFRDADFLLSAPLFVVDIETNTQPPEDTADEWPKKTYGVSFAADITDVAFYVPGHDPVVLNVRGYPADAVAFVRNVFNRPNYTAIGHYVLFDLRSLGGHFGFMLPRGVKVYDTKVMSALLMFGEPEKDRGRGQLSLQYQVEFLDLYEDEDDKRFYDIMKEYRVALQEMAENLQQTEPGSVLWRYTKGFPRFEDKRLPGAQVDQHQFVLSGEEVTDLSTFDLSEHAQQIIEQYVAMDVIFPYKIYNIHQHFIEQVHVNGVKMNDHLVVPKWTAVKELVDWEQRISWVSANLSIRGVDLDVNYAEMMRDEWDQLILEERDTVLNMPDKTDPHADWNKDFQMMMWYSRVLDAVRGEGAYNDITKWVNWRESEIGWDTIADSFQFTTKPDTPKEYQMWVDSWMDWIGTLTPDTKRSAALKSVPTDLPVPTINMVEWVRQQCFPEQHHTIGAYLAKAKTNWLTFFYTQNKKLPPSKIVNSDAWQVYHLFVVCGIELPSREEIVEEADLTTKSYQQLVKQAYDLAEKNPGMVVDEQGIALRSDTLSLGKNAMKYYLEREELAQNTTPEFQHFSALMQAEADYDRAKEFLLHASRDGKIHSTIDRGGTRTHRYSSTTPNLQNINLKRFRGFLIPPPGFVLIELDYANAENKMGAMISRDDGFAYATESGDFHTEMFKTYDPELYNSLVEAGDYKALKDWRDFFKRVTFSIPYGAGPAKVARIMKKGIEDARRVITARREAYPMVEKKKKEVGENCIARYKKGLVPAYVPLWTGSRVIVPTWPDKRSGEWTPSVYKTWNYMQQGGVAEMIARAQVLAYEHLLDKGYETYIVLNVHDSIILAVKIEEWPHVVQEVVQIMCAQMPAELCRSTMPPVHFVTEVGPENAEKWGWQYGKEYPLPLDEFVNQWGCHKLPEGAKPEAPTWVGPVHEGWTLQKEMDEIKAANARLAVGDATMTANADVVAQGNEWYEMNDILTEFEHLLSDLAYFGVGMKPHRQAANVRYMHQNGGAPDFKIVGPFAFPERMIASRALEHNGHNIESYRDTLDKIKVLLTLEPKLIEWVEKIKSWREQYGEVYYNAPEQPNA